MLVSPPPSLLLSLILPIAFQGWRSWGWRVAPQGGGRGGTAAAFPPWEGRAQPLAAPRWVGGWVGGLTMRAIGLQLGVI